jgi:hypothetical protein
MALKVCRASDLNDRLLEYDVAELAGLVVIEGPTDHRPRMPLAEHERIQLRLAGERTPVVGHLGRLAVSELGPGRSAELRRPMRYTVDHPYI